MAYSSREAAVHCGRERHSKQALEARLAVKRQSGHISFTHRKQREQEVKKGSETSGPSPWDRLPLAKFHLLKVPLTGTECPDT